MVARVLERPTLVLNRNWQPVGVITVAKSLVKVWNDAARHYDEAALSALLLSISVTNVYNRLNVATRQVAGAWKP